MRPPTPADDGASFLGAPVVSSPAHSGGDAAFPVAAALPGPAPAGSPGSGGGMLAAPVAEALAIAVEPGRFADAGISAGGCFVRPLPIDTTCASAARRFFREALSSLALPSGLLHDGVTMASELAANTLHAQRDQGFGAPRPRGSVAIPEIWVYLRSSGRARELVCKVFDTERSWTAGFTPGMSKAPVDSVSGRGLQVVDGLSAGHWGCHLSRSRLGNWKLAGKAVWFALRIPPGVLPDYVGRPRYSPDLLINELELMLAERGLSSSIMRADMDGSSVLSISRYLTVWRHGPTVSWRTAAGDYQRMDMADLVDVAEQVVCAHEEASLGTALAG
jgi:hypothetical protein